MHELKKLNVPVILNTPVTKELVDSVKPDVVIAATGTTPVVPKKIPGYDKDIVVLGTDVLSGKAKHRAIMSLLSAAVMPVQKLQTTSRLT